MLDLYWKYIQAKSLDSLLVICCVKVRFFDLILEKIAKLVFAYVASEEPTICVVRKNSHICYLMSFF